MSTSWRRFQCVAPLLALLVEAGCSTPSSQFLDVHQSILYVGSSTVANFLREAEAAHGKVRFTLDTVPESLGGERTITEGYADLAGVACEPAEETLALGVNATLLGSDTIAIVVNETNHVPGLSLAQLRAIFSGELRNWKEVGGPDLEIIPFIMGQESATHGVFRAVVLGGDEYACCRVVRPDQNMPMMVEAEQGGIGTVSSSFLCAGGVVRVLKVEGESSLPDNDAYPIRRPLYLLWRPGNPVVAAFIDWTRTPEAEAVLVKCFGKPRKRVP